MKRMVKKEFFDPQATDFMDNKIVRSISVPKYQNSSFGEEDKDSLIKSIESFDKGNNNVGKIVPTDKGTFMITATSTHSPYAFETANPLENHLHQVQWEWVLIREVPDVQCTMNEFINVLDNYQSLSIFIIPILAITIFGIIVTLMRYKKGSRKTLGDL